MVHFFVICLNTPGANVMPKKSISVQNKFVLFGLTYRCTLWSASSMAFTFCSCSLTVSDQITMSSRYMAKFSKQLPQSSIYMLLVNIWGVLKSHRHNEPLIQTQWCIHCCQWYVFRLHLSLEKTICHVYCDPDLTLHTV